MSEQERLPGRPVKDFSEQFDLELQGTDPQITVIPSDSLMAEALLIRDGHVAQYFRYGENFDKGRVREQTGLLPQAARRSPTTVVSGSDLVNHVAETLNREYDNVKKRSQTGNALARQARERELAPLEVLRTSVLDYRNARAEKILLDGEVRSRIGNRS